MKKSVVWVSIFSFVFCIVCLPLAAEETAEEIMRSARSQAEITSVGTRAKMEIQKDGITVNELVIDQYSSRDSKHSRRTFMEFKAPAQAKGTRFLMIVKENGIPAYLFTLSWKNKTDCRFCRGDTEFYGNGFFIQ